MPYLFVEPPSDFNPKVEISSCYCEHEDKILLVKRHPKKPYGQTWGVPAGKLELNETPYECVIRETQEEVGLNVNTPELEWMATFYFRIPEVDYLYHMFRHPFAQFPLVTLELNEHLEERWVTLEQAFSLPLIIGGAEALHHYIRLKK